MQSHSSNFARRLELLDGSIVHQALSMTEMADVISFAGGLPAIELFPTAELTRAFHRVITEEGPAALQYSMTEGFPPLRKYIASRLHAQGMSVTDRDVLITSGAQQGLDLAAKVLLNPGDKVLVSRPTYMVALQTFSIFEAQFITVACDDQDMDVDQVRRKLQENPDIKLIYLVSNFQNPAGTTLSLERRKRLVQLAQQYHVHILEDDPYAQLRYRGEPVPSVKSLDESGLVIYLGSFSKTIAPGLRLGWLVAEPQIYQKLLIAKQSTDLHTSTLNQRVVHRFLIDDSEDEQIAKIRTVYGGRCRIMLEAMERYLPRQARWTRPEGGMFLWVELSPQIDTEKLLAEALEEKIAFVPGAAFFAIEHQHNFIRLNFSSQPPSKIEEGIARLAQVIARHRCHHFNNSARP